MGSRGAVLRAVRSLTAGRPPLHATLLDEAAAGSSYPRRGSDKEGGGGVMRTRAETAKTKRQGQDQFPARTRQSR